VVDDGRAAFDVLDLDAAAAQRGQHLRQAAAQDPNRRADLDEPAFAVAGVLFLPEPGLGLRLGSLDVQDSTCAGHPDAQWWRHGAEDADVGGLASRPRPPAAPRRRVAGAVILLPPQLLGGPARYRPS